MSPEALRATTEHLGPLWSHSAEVRARLKLHRGDGDYGNATGWTWCMPREGDGQGQWLVVPGEPVDPVPILLEMARERLVVPDPVIAMSPPVGAEVVPVGLPVWFWAENFEARSERAEVSGSWVQVDARPTSVSVRIVEPWKDGQTHRSELDCEGGGTPFDPARHDEWSESSCSHAFRWAGDAEIEMSVTWALSWSASTGAGGELGSVGSSASTELHLTAMEAATH